MFLTGRKLNISSAFLSQSYFNVLKTMRPNATYFIMKISNKREPQTASNSLPYSDFKDFMKLYKDYTKETDLLLVNGTTLSS